MIIEKFKEFGESEYYRFFKNLLNMIKSILSKQNFYQT